MSDVSNMPVRVFEADGGQIKLRFKLQEFKKYRFLLHSLVQRDLKSRYKNSLLGILWSLLNPLALMLVFTLVFSVFSGGQDYRQYPVFVLVGLLPWNFFSGSLMSGTVSVVGNSALIKKVYFPRELLPVSSLLSNLVNFLIALIILVIFLYAYDLGLTIYALWVPVILLTQMIFTLVLVLFLSSFTVFYRDILMILDVVLLAWFFLTPIFYPLEIYNQVSEVMGIAFSPARVMRWLNPMASIIDSYRTVLWGNMGSDGPANMDPGFFLRTLTTAVLTLVIGYIVFARTEHLFGERL